MMTRARLVAVVGLVCLTALPQIAHGEHVVVDLAAKFGGITQQAFHSGIAFAMSHFMQSPDDVVELYVEPGTHVIHESDYLIQLDDLNPGPNGRLVIRGNSSDSTSIYTDGAWEPINGHNVRRFTLSGIHFGRNTRYSTQGTVVSVAAGEVTVKIAGGFPTPAFLYNRNSSQGRFLRRYTNSLEDPQLVGNESINSGWPPQANAQVVWNNATIADPTSNEWTFQTSMPNVTPQYSPGDFLCVKSKHLAQAYGFFGGDNITFDGLLWTETSRGVFRNGISNILVANCRIDRTTLGKGVMCLSSPGGGPQLGQPNDPPIYNVTVTNYTATGTGDDSVAFFHVESGGISNVVIRDSFARGILLDKCNADQIVRKNLSLVRCPMWITDKV